jgi:tRNA (adenine22-N1)-methyltransferase
MELSSRLMKIVKMVDSCSSIADIGTDHAYLPIYLIKNGICKSAIASDINEGPVKKAKNNILFENLQNKIKCIKSEGLKHLLPYETDGIVIAGMGGNLTRDIINDKLEVFKSLKFAILNPAQNVEVLREYIYKSGYEILDEDLCIDENIFYEIIKVRYANHPKEMDSIFYEVSSVLLQKKHPLIGALIEKKLYENEKILSFIKEGTPLADKRKKEICIKIRKLEELLECL